MKVVDEPKRLFSLSKSSSHVVMGLGVFVYYNTGLRGDGGKGWAWDMGFSVKEGGEAGWMDGWVVFCFGSHACASKAQQLHIDDCESWVRSTRSRITWAAIDPIRKSLLSVASGPKAEGMGNSHT